MGVEDPWAEACAYVRGNGELRDALAVPRATELAVLPLGQGEHNANFTLSAPDGRRFVLRMNYISQLGLADQVGYEFAALSALEPSGRAPRGLYVDNSRRRCRRGVLVESFVEGSWLDFSRPDQVREAARVLADIHAAPVSEEARLALQCPADPLADQLAACEGFLAAYVASSLADPRVVGAAEALLAQARAAAAAVPPAADLSARSIVNTEAVPSHFLMDRSGRGSMVDWEKPHIGEAAQDVAYFLSPTTTIWDTDFIFDRPAREQFVAWYREASGERLSSAAFEGRFRAYVMANALVGITWSLNAWVEYHDPARPLKNDKTRERLPRYFSADFLARVRRDCFSEA